MPEYLIVTNGAWAVALLARLGLPAELLAWDDVLHDGPLRFQGDWHMFAEDRAAALAAFGFGEHRQILQRFYRRDLSLQQAGNYREVVLWFEHDLYDQLQLLQVICQLSDGFGADYPVSTILTDQHISAYTDDQRQRQWQQRQPLTQAQRILARETWHALNASEPVHLPALVPRAGPLPHLQAGLERWFEEFPDPRAGLALTERYILQALAQSGELSPGALFGAYNDMEVATFLGDWSFWRYVAGLTQGPAPALVTADAKPLVYPPQVNGAEFLQQTLRLTPVGKALLDGEYQWFCHPWQQRWLGGVFQTGNDHWRWHPQQRQFYKVSLAAGTAGQQPGARPIKGTGA